MTTRKFPSIANVARALRDVNNFADDECDVRLQVWEDGEWRVRFGDAQYDQDHRGFWGASSVPGGRKRFNSVDVARDLLDQAREHAAQSEE